MSLDQLQGDTTQNNPNMLPPLAGRRGPFPVGEGGGLASILQPGLISVGPGFNNPILNRPMPLPVRPPGFGNFIGIQPPMQLPQMPDYSSQFEQIGGIGKQFESVNNKLDSLEKGLGSLGNQIASFENMQKAEPQEVRQPQQPSYSPFGFGGLANLFMNMRRF